MRWDGWGWIVVDGDLGPCCNVIFSLGGDWNLGWVDPNYSKNGVISPINIPMAETQWVSLGLFHLIYVELWAPAYNW